MGFEARAIDQTAPPAQAGHLYGRAGAAVMLLVKDGQNEVNRVDPFADKPHPDAKTAFLAGGGSEKKLASGFEAPVAMPFCAENIGFWNS